MKPVHVFVKAAIMQQSQQQSREFLNGRDASVEYLPNHPQRLLRHPQQSLNRFHFNM
jgi:hypothetical protein